MRPGALPLCAPLRARKLLAVGALGLAACAEAEPGTPAGQPWFAEVAHQAGIRFVHRSGHEPGRFLIPEVVAGGVALLDADGDGWLDVYFVQAGSLAGASESGPGNQLYRNRGDGTFEDVSAANGADERSYGMGVATGDYDDDGRPDLYLTNVGPNRLLQNRGGMAFRDATAEAAVGHEGFGSSAAFFDYDRDGDLDLYVANYLVWSVATEKECFNGLGQRDYCAPALYNAPASDVLYRNEGDGTFADVTRAAGIGAAFGTGLGVLCGDFTADGWADVFVANDGLPNQMWVNLGDGRFEDRGLLLGCALDQDAIPKAGMGVVAEDFDDDGDLDLLVGNLRRESDSLFQNQGGYFRDVTGLRGLGQISRSFTRFGTGWVDFDNDGYLDLYQANGRVAAEENAHGSADPLAEPNLLFRGGPERFEEVLPRGGTAALLVHASRGAAFGDLDNDGGVDVVVVNRDAPTYVLSNRLVGRGDWLLVRVLDEHGRDAIGASLTLRAGGRVLRREVRTALGYASASDPRVHFGLGTGTTIEDLEVQWVDGGVESVPVPGVNRVLEVRRRARHAGPR